MILQNNEMGRGCTHSLLLLLLGASTAPPVIDQPEDDLNNRFFYDGVVAKLRKLKGIRQVVASTDNANVPVLGDAERIIALEGDSQHGNPAPDGVCSLDDTAIRSIAENLLEGGPRRSTPASTSMASRLVADWQLEVARYWRRRMEGLVRWIGYWC